MSIIRVSRDRHFITTICNDEADSHSYTGGKERWKRSVRARGYVLLLAKRDQFSINVI